MRWRMVTAGAASLAASLLLHDAGHGGGALAAALLGFVLISGGLVLPGVAGPRRGAAW